ncbi:pyridoxamine 5'-phosphate oxidase family protein [Kitasatospora sp. NBC_01539]|uniref:pyridoxamine 5'-phosphate oxidase family protein n=1 Tax=Kitasatospora sp. NBC_01539 TaxID=2903577 RepID=UPI00386015EC
MEYDDPAARLGEDECRRLLATVPVGRVVYTERALPAVLPVAFEVAPDGRLLLALRAGCAAARALDGTVAAFQADLVDPVTRTGWSVLVHGRAHVLREPPAAAGARGGGAPGAGVALTPELVAGRRLGPSAVRSPADK